MRLLILTPLCLLVSTQSAFADDFDRSNPREKTYCFPAKYVTEMTRKINEVDSSKRDVVDIAMAPKFKIYDGGKGPDRFYLRTDASEIEFSVSSDYAVPDFLSVVNKKSGKGDICIDDAARVGRPGDDESLYFEMGLTPKFETQTLYDYASLKEGTKDAKSLYKRMVPSVARLFMPDTKHLSVTMSDQSRIPIVSALKDGKAFGEIEITAYGESYIFPLSTLKDMGADAISISGDHTLSPVPSMKIMKRFGIGQKKIYTKNEDGEWVL